MDLTTTPAPSLSATLTGLRALDDQGFLDDIECVEQQIRALQAYKCAQMAELASRVEAAGAPISGAAETVAVISRISSRSADHLLDTSQAICQREVIWEALATARIDRAKAVLIAELLAEVPDPRREHLELVAIDYAETHTGYQLRRRLLAMTCANVHETLRREAIDRRCVNITPAGHGMADIHAHLSAEHAEAFITALDLLAGHPDCPDPHDQTDQRTPSQFRADALIGFLQTHTRLEIAVTVTIDADTLIGAQHHTADLNGSPITAGLARHLAWSPDARWQRLITDPTTGQLIELTADTYRIPERIRTHIKARDLTCRFPGCHSRAEHADIDHTTPWPAGPTNSNNLAALCRRHHRVKTFSRWKVHTDPYTGDLIWTSPLGTTHRKGRHNYHPRD